MTKLPTIFTMPGLLLTLLVSLNQWSPAAAPPQSEADLLASTSHIIRGVVVSRYHRNEKKEKYDYTYSILEIEVAAIAKGAGIEAKDRVFVRCWQRVWAGQGPANPGIHGQDSIPVRGDTVQVYLKGDRKLGFDVIEPNGFLKITRPGKTSEQGGDGQTATRSETK